MYKKNEIVNKFLLAGDKFMPEMYLKEPRFTYSACGQRNNSKIKKKAGDAKYVYRNKLDKSCFQIDMSYGDFKDLVKITASGKV